MYVYALSRLACRRAIGIHRPTRCRITFLRTHIGLLILSAVGMGVGRGIAALCGNSLRISLSGIKMLSIIYEICKGGYVAN
jgi:hypothetical protein